MKTTLRCCALVGVVLVCRSSLWADDQSHLKAAEDLLQAMNTPKMMTTMIDQSLDAQIKANPQLASQKDVLKQFFAKNLSYDALKGDLAKMYADEFTEDELKQLIAFYQSPIGKKSVEKMPGLAAKGAQLGAARVQANQGELIKMLQDNMAKQAAPK